MLLGAVRVPMWMIRKVSERENAMGGSCESALIHKRGTLEAEFSQHPLRLEMLELFVCISCSKISKISRGTNNKSSKWWKHCRSRLIVLTFTVESGSKGDDDVWYERERDEKAKGDEDEMRFMFHAYLHTNSRFFRGHCSSSAQQQRPPVARFADFHFTFDLTLIDMFYETRKVFHDAHMVCKKSAIVINIRMSIKCMMAKMRRWDVPEETIQRSTEALLREWNIWRFSFILRNWIFTLIMNLSRKKFKFWAYEMDFCPHRQRWKERNFSYR